MSIAAILGTGILAFFLGLVVGVRGADVAMLAWAIATCCVCALPLAIDRTLPQTHRHIALSMLGIGFALRFAFPVFTYYLPATGPVDSPDLPYSFLLPADIAYAQALLFLGLCALLLGYLLPIGRGVSRLVPKARFEWAEGASLTAAVALIGFGWLIFLLSQFGMLPERLGSGLIGAFSDATLFGAAILAVTFLRKRSIPALVLMLVLVPITSGFNFFTGYKRLVLTPPAIVALTWMIYERRIRLRWMVLGFVALFSLYPAAQFYRQVVLDRNTRTLSDVARDPAPAFEALGDFVSSTRAFQYLGEGFDATAKRLDGVGHASVIIRDTPSVVPYQGGRTLALVPTMYIPRAIWPDKPTISIGAWIIDNYRIVGEEVESSIGPTWVGEFYLNFGVWAIAPGMLLLGMLLRFAHETLSRVPTSLAIVLEAILIYQIFLKQTGSMVDIVNGPILIAIPILLTHLLIRLLGGARPFEASEAPSEPASALRAAT